MLQKHLQFSLAFALIFILQLFLETDTDTAKLVFADFQYAIKPLITISLMIYLVYHTQLRGRFSKRIFIGLFFGLIGDCCLMFVHVDQVFFTLGLAAFLIGHLAYISAFYLDYAWARGIQKSLAIFSVIIFGLIGVGFYWYLSPYLGNLKYPVMAYALTISLMAIMAANRKGRVNGLSFNLMMWGAVLFLISDSLLAYNKFVDNIIFGGIFIMITYMIAQYVITIGAIERKLRKHSVITK